VDSAWVESVRLVATVCVSTALANLGLALVSYGFATDVWLPFALGETLRWAVLGGFLALLDSFRRRRLQSGARARETGVARAALRAQTELAQMQLLEAQIEPHFLFNTIANLRRTWNVDPELGLRMHDNLLRYLRAALPQMRAALGTLGEEAELVRAYLELFSLRMGARLAFAIEVPEALGAQAFPRMMLITLTENALKHGLMPSDSGGTVRVEAQVEAGRLVVSVSDDGVGFGAADTGGTGVSLANIRARLATQYPGAASLVVESGTAGPLPQGVRATIRLPLAGAAPQPKATEHG
jgi:LytS/YehU family sensor histidine kinase